MNIRLLPPPSRPVLRIGLIMLLAWMGLVALFVVQIQILSELSWQQAFILSFFRWLPWMLLSPLIFWLTSRFPLTAKDHIVRNGLIHLVAALLLAISAQMVADTVCKPMELRFTGDVVRPSPNRNQPRPRPQHYGEPPPPEELRPPRDREADSSLLISGVRHLVRTLPTYFALLGLQSILLFSVQIRQKERQALELQTKLTQARLDALKLQLQPHFLFNALNAISTILHRDPKKADQMICDLSTLLRGVIEERNYNELPLRRELDLLAAYTNIEQLRFGDRVKFEQHISPDCLDAQVPTLLLQPILENAVRHGVVPLDRPGTIWLSAERRGELLKILVQDDGVGRQSMDSGSKGLGIGLTNARAQLEAIYGKTGYLLELTDRADGGTVVCIEFPFKKSIT